MTDLMKGIEQAEKEARAGGYASQGGDWFKFVEGENVFRVLTPFVAIYESFQDGICFIGCGFEGAPKQMCYVLDMREKNIDNEVEPKIKLAKLPMKVATPIANYQHDDDYKFDSLPMPYDVKVQAKGAGTKEVEYTITPRPKHTPIDKKYLDELGKLKPIEEIVQKMKEKNATKHGKTLPSQQAEMKSLEEIASEQGYEYPESDDEAVPPF